MADTFMTFASLAKCLGVDQVADGVNCGLRFNGTEYNAPIHKACVSLWPVLEHGSLFKEAILRLELAWGRDLLSTQYTKLRRLIDTAKSSANGDRTEDFLAAWLVDQANLALNVKLIAASKVTEVWLERDRKHGIPGFWPCALMLLEAGRAKDLPCSSPDCLGLMKRRSFLKSAAGF